MREEIERYALPGAAPAVEVKAGVLGERAEVLGAIALVIADTERLRSAGLAPIGRRRLARARGRRVAQDALGELRRVAEDPRDREALVRDDAARQQRRAADRRSLADVAVGPDRGRAADLRALLDGDVRPRTTGPSILAPGSMRQPSSAQTPGAISSPGMSTRTWPSTASRIVLRSSSRSPTSFQ